MSPTNAPPSLSSARSTHSPIESVLAFSIDCFAPLPAIIIQDTNV